MQEIAVLGWKTWDHSNLDLMCGNQGATVGLPGLNAARPAAAKQVNAKIDK